MRRIEVREVVRGVVSGYSKDDFSAPVEDYNFSAIEDVRSLIDQMGRAGGFTATQLANARDMR